MKDCRKCKKKICLEIKKPCSCIENKLRKEGIKSSNWIRPKMPSDKRHDGNIWRELPFPDVFGHI